MTAIQTVRELIEVLEDFDPDSPVRVATQPHYPIAHTILNVDSVSSVVWIGADQVSSYSESPYAPSGAFGDEF